MYMIVEVSQYVAVASFSEAWIEITNLVSEATTYNVASFSEAWIEIFVRLWDSQAPMSPPSRRRGLKCKCRKLYRLPVLVASFSEAWIEIDTAIRLPLQDGVASFSEAWIEIFAVSLIIRHNDVASFSEAWIEILVFVLL